MENTMLKTFALVAVVGASLAMAQSRIKVKRAAAVVEVELINASAQFLPDGTCTQTVEVRIVGDDSPRNQRTTKARQLTADLCAKLRVAAASAAAAEFGNGI